MFPSVIEKDSGSKSREYCRNPTLNAKFEFRLRRLEADRPAMARGKHSPRDERIDGIELSSGQEMPQRGPMVPPCTGNESQLERSEPVAWLTFGGPLKSETCSTQPRHSYGDHSLDERGSRVQRIELSSSLEPVEGTFWTCRPVLSRLLHVTVGHVARYDDRYKKEPPNTCYGDATARRRRRFPKILRRARRQRDRGARDGKRWAAQTGVFPEPVDRSVCKPDGSR